MPRKTQNIFSKLNGSYEIPLQQLINDILTETF